MRKIMFKDNFVDVDEEFLSDLKINFYMALGAYKQKIEDVSHLAPNYKHKTEAGQVLKLVRAMLAKRSTVGTEELEGYKPDMDQLEKNLKENKLSITDESSVALSILKAYLEYDLPDGIFTKENIKGIHSMLFESNKENYKSGKFRKKGDNNVMIESAQKEFIDSKLVDSHMDKFVLFYNATTKLETITKAAMIHGVLVGIHPFKDGNGRVTRFITDKFVSKELGVPLFLSEAINSHSDNTEYTTALDQFHLELNSLPLIRFFYNVAINQIKSNTKMIEDWIKKIFLNSELLSKKKVSPKYLNDLAIILSDAHYIYTSKLANELNVTAVTASTIISSLEEKGIIGNSKMHGRVLLYEVKI